MTRDSPHETEFSTWIDYDNLTIAIQKEGRRVVHLMPHEVRAKVHQLKQQMVHHNITENNETKAFHDQLLANADEVDRLRKQKSE